LADLLQDVPPSRLFDEMLKLFLSGHAVESINALRAQHLHHGLLPLLDVVLEQPLGERFVMLALQNTDDRINQGKSSNPSFLFATLALA
jgi:poly(A) polymerase